MPGHFSARLQLIQDPLQCMNSWSDLPASRYFVILLAESHLPAYCPEMVPTWVGSLGCLSNPFSLVLCKYLDQARKMHLVLLAWNTLSKHHFSQFTAPTIDLWLLSLNAYKKYRNWLVGTEFRRASGDPLRPHRSWSQREFSFVSMQKAWNGKRDCLRLWGETGA